MSFSLTSGSHLNWPFLQTGKPSLPIRLTQEPLLESDGFHVSDAGGADGPRHEVLTLYPMISPWFTHSLFTVAYLSHISYLLVQVLGTQQ